MFLKVSLKSTLYCLTVPQLFTDWAFRHLNRHWWKDALFVFIRLCVLHTTQTLTVTKWLFTCRFQQKHRQKPAC
ncbi:Uncharacterised protein [Mycobacterium tuberculosis]|nr:Uncharacterised protein [Mycobacterium tuberculosis]